MSATWTKTVKNLQNPFDGVIEVTTEITDIMLDGVWVPGSMSLDDSPDDATIQQKVESFLAGKGYPVVDPVAPTLLGAIKARSYQLRTQVNAYINGIYDSGNQSTINALWNEGSMKGWSNRKAKCQDVLDWVNTILTLFYAKLAEVAVSPDIPTALAVTMDLAPFNATVPPDSIKSIIDTVD